MKRLSTASVLTLEFILASPGSPIAQPKPKQESQADRSRITRGVRYAALHSLRETGRNG
jgi:hypothetical protein